MGASRRALGELQIMYQAMEDMTKDMVGTAKKMRPPLSPKRNRVVSTYQQNPLVSSKPLFEGLYQRERQPGLSPAVALRELRTLELYT